ncbi:iron-dicitrate transporter ATP-binding subunit [Clostridium botulinum]|uniref:ABC transporter ATP-binding protein n=1 Tax=Clostridium botulinum TaxID=1491 RepID=UPI0001F85097|nr:ABC transporter ATP-binding protein [Clostridium botulinum]KOM98739.1 iron-dicitrate transporter ATP-binding subunit [Clostridium botulinum]KON00013.1 iron-dicitrate transporter ATP-binding subunit [Clostridium botulinum]MBY7002774.1 ABC transporter ATP-binding protein [Clostridium botulinum]MCJ8171199.1 ABC transporter ATP-binding protein [Clostridium botulinum]MCR1146777.1 ABC transporter ATP-binding protein [Clostridium botulinum]
MNSITTTNLAIAYEDKLIVDGLNMNIPKGKITTIIGPNGCGKSTVLKTIGRILEPKEGLVYLNGDDIRKFSTKEVAQKMAILPQSPQAQGGLTVGELVSYGRFPHKKGFGKLSPEDKKVIQWALDITKLTELEVTMVDNLSGGQRQRVWIAMALAQQTDLILLDEPTTYLDMAYQLEVLELLYNLNREESCTIVMVLHDLNLAARFADYMIAIRSGNIVRCGTPKEIMTNKVLKDTFNIDAEIVWGSKTDRPTCISYELIK